MTRSVGRAIAHGGALSLARLLTGVVRVKVLALALGVEGVGIYAILLQLYLTGVAAVSMSLAVPIINLGRPRLTAGDIGEAGKVAGTALAVVSFNGLLLILLAGIFGQELMGELGVGAVAGEMVWPIAIAVAIGAISGAFWEGMSYLTDRFDVYVRAGVIGAIGDMLLVAGGASLFGLQGAVFGMAAGTMTLFGAYALLILRDSHAREVLRHLSAKLGLLPQLFAYSAMMFAAVAATNAALTFLRSRVLVEAGAAANGYLQVVTSLSAYLLPFVMTGFWGHLHPLAAANGDTPEVRRELSRSLHLGLLIGFTGCGAAMVLAPVIIPLFYSREFADAAGLLIAYLPGELCFQLFSMLVAYQLTVSLRRLYLGLNLGYVVMLVTAGAMLIPSLGSGGYVAAHVGASLVMAFVVLFIAAAKGQVEKPLVLLAVGLIICVAVMAVLLMFAREAGAPLLATSPALLPFAVSGGILVTRFRRGHRRPLASSDRR